VTEAGVALTDYALALEVALFALHLGRWRSAGDAVLRQRFVVFFAGSAVAAAAGGTVHGFMPGSATLWAVSLVALGVPALAAWGIAGRLLVRVPWQAWLWRLAVGEFAGYTLVVVAGARAFAVAIVNYLPAALALTVAFARARSTRSAGAGWGLTGMGLIFVGAGVQAARIAPHPRLFDHNALYHVIDGVAALLIFVAARGLGAARPEP
jgi:hypothetical protein